MKEGHGRSTPLEPSPSGAFHLRELHLPEPEQFDLLVETIIELGVDIPTVSRWLGHKDGGALAMKVYGHLRDHHSVEMAQKVTFSKQQPENVVANYPNQKAG